MNNLEKNTQFYRFLKIGIISINIILVVLSIYDLFFIPITIYTILIGGIVILIYSVYIDFLIKKDRISNIKSTEIFIEKQIDDHEIKKNVKKRRKFYGLIIKVTGIINVLVFIMTYLLTGNLGTSILFLIWGVAISSITILPVLMILDIELRNKGKN